MIKVIVKGHPKASANGRWIGTLSPQGLTLTRKSQVISVPVGSQSVYSGDNRLSVPHADGHLYLQIASFGCYQNRLACDLAEWLSGKREMPLESNYSLERSLFALCVLPFGIPVLTLGGALPALVAFGLAALNLKIAQRGEWPKSGRIAGCLSLALIGYGMAVSLILWTAKLGGEGDHETNSQDSDTPALNRSPDNFIRDESGRKIWTGPVGSGVIPTPEASGSPLSGETRSVDDLSVQLVNLPGEPLTPNMQWSEDAKHLFIYGSDGVLRKVAFPSLMEEIVLETKQNGGSMGWCKHGLLIGLNKPGQIWLIDPETLEVNGRFHANEKWEFNFYSVRESSYVYVSNDEGDRLTVIEPKSGEVVSRTDIFEMERKYGRPFRISQEKGFTGGFKFAAISPDGKHLFCEGWGCLNRLRITGEELIYEDRTPEICSGNSYGKEVFISADSQFVAVPSGGGNYRRDKYGDHIKGKEDYVTYLFGATDLKEPVLTLAGGRHPNTMAIDQVSGEIYMHNSLKKLIIFSEKGVRRKDYQLSGEDDRVRQLLVHPSGGRMLILTDSSLLFVNLQQ